MITFFTAFTGFLTKKLSYTGSNLSPPECQQLFIPLRHSSLTSIFPVNKISAMNICKICVFSVENFHRSKVFSSHRTQILHFNSNSPKILHILANFSGDTSTRGGVVFINNTMEIFSPDVISFFQGCAFVSRIQTLMRPNLQQFLVECENFKMGVLALSKATYKIRLPEVI